jgi:hypothetical protein
MTGVPAVVVSLFPLRSRRYAADREATAPRVMWMTPRLPYSVAMKSSSRPRATAAETAGAGQVGGVVLEVRGVPEVTGPEGLLDAGLLTGHQVSCGELLRTGRVDPYRGAGVVAVHRERDSLTDLAVVPVQRLGDTDDLVVGAAGGTATGDRLTGQGLPLDAVLPATVALRPWGQDGEQTEGERLPRDAFDEDWGCEAGHGGPFLVVQVVVLSG